MYKALIPVGDVSVELQDGIRFSDSSDSSLYQAHPPSGHAYFAQLHKQYHAMIGITEEQLCPPSRPTSPNRDSRVDALRQRVVETWALAGGEPSNGKWGVIARLLRTGCTTGGYVIEPVRFEKAHAKRRRLLKLPDTEDEWFELEQQSILKGERDNALNRKIELWQADVMPHATDTNTVVSVYEENLSKAGSQEKVKFVKKTSQLGFPVVKASSNLTNSKRRPRKTSIFFPSEKPREPPTASSAPQPKSVSQVDRLDKFVNGVSRDQPTSKLDCIARPEPSDDLSEMFLAPSFPSNLHTSTPRPAEYSANEKSSPLMAASPPLLPPWYSSSMPCGGHAPDKASCVEPGRIYQSIDGSAPTASPVKDKHHVSSLVQTLPQEPSSSLTALTQININNTSKILQVDVERRPVTPPLATPLGNARGRSVSPRPEIDGLSVPMEPLATSQKSSVRPRPPPRQIFPPGKPPPLNPFTETDADQEPDGMDFIARPSTPLTPLTERTASPTKSYFSSPASQSPQNAILNELVRSPISPLFFNTYNPFAPQFHNTPRRDADGFQRSQLQADIGSIGPSTQQPMMYNSQFDVDRHIADFDAFMADDVGVHVDSGGGGGGGKYIDLDGWMGDAVSDL